MRTGGSSIRNFCSHFFIFLMAVEHLSQYRTNITNQDQDTNSNTRNPSLFVSCMHDFSPFFVLGFELKEEERKKLEPVPFIRSSIQRLPHNCLSKPSLSLSLSQRSQLYIFSSLRFHSWLMRSATEPFALAHTARRAPSKAKYAFRF